MEYRRLGKTNLNVSVIGVGTEYLKALPKEKISQIISLALDAGINYFDLVWNMPNIVEGCATALKGHREKIALALHLGSCIKSGKYYRSRDPKECELQLKSVISTLGQNFFHCNQYPLCGKHENLAGSEQKRYSCTCRAIKK